MNKFKIGVVFELEKDHPFLNAQKLKVDLQKKYNLTNAECSYVYRLIINHQIKTYGIGLNGSYLKDRKVNRTDDNFKRKSHRK